MIRLGKRPRPTLNEIVMAAARLSRIGEDELLAMLGSARRLPPEHLDALRLVVVAGRQEGYSLAEIGAALRRDHSTVLHHWQAWVEMWGEAAALMAADVFSARLIARDLALQRVSDEIAAEAPGRLEVSP